MVREPRCSTSFVGTDSKPGFLAAAYADGSLIISDSRGPKILKRYDSIELRPRSGLHMNSSLDPIISLHWTLSRGSDSAPSQQLIAVKQSGHALVFALGYLNSRWSIASEPLEAEGIANPLPRPSSFVFDAKTGTSLRATDRGLNAIARGDTIGFNDCVWLACGAKGARTSSNITGHRIAKIDWPGKYGRVEQTQVVEHSGMIHQE
jgi:syntaxin-binding protein 5